MRIEGFVIGAVAAILLTGCGDDAADPDPDPAADRSAIETALKQWPTAFDSGDIDAVCGLFAPDVVVKYPDSADRDYDAFCTQMRGVLTNPDRTFSYATPEISEILVDGDLATVRIEWTLTVSDKAGTVLETVVEDGIDVFVRQPDGSWKIHISHAFPL